MFMLLWAVVGLCFWVEGRERGVDCVCATEPPCSSDNSVSPGLQLKIQRILSLNREV